MFSSLVRCATTLLNIYNNIRRETRPKILWNTGKRLETARLPEGSAAPTTPTAAGSSAGTAYTVYTIYCALLLV